MPQKTITGNMAPKTLFHANLLEDFHLCLGV